MKALYSITLLLILSLVSCKDNKGDTENSLKTKLSDLTQYQTTLDKAKEEIFMYEMGLQMVPQNYQWNSEEHIINYGPQTIENDTLIKIIDSLNHEAPLLPETAFSSDNSLARSYFIHREDIKAMMAVLDQYESSDVNGIRIYLAANSDTIESSHVYIGPALSEPEEFVFKNYYLGNEDDPYLYDLTTPCPNACDRDAEFTQLPATLTK